MTASEVQLRTEPEPRSPLGTARHGDHPGPVKLLGEFFGGSVGSITIAFVVVFLVGLFYVGTEFVGSGNFSILATYATVPLLIGTFAGFALLSGVVDLSIGPTAGFCGAVFAYLVLHHYDPWEAAGVAVATGLVIGAVNALAVVVFRANAIAATIGMALAVTGLQYVVCGQNGSLTVLVNGLYNFCNRSLGPAPLVFWLTLLLVLIAAYIVMFTRVGRHVRAAGGDEVAARRSGISVNRIRCGAFLLSGLGASLGGLLYMGQLGGVTNTLGTDLAFEVYAALMIGGYSIIRGGVGNPIGGALGVLVVAGVTDIISLKSISTYYTDVIIGILLIAAVFLDRVRGGDAFE